MSQVEITNIVYKGAVKRTQADEYVEITNLDKTPADISGWFITSDIGKSKNFTFPGGTILNPGQSVRVYTNEVHKESGGFSYGSNVSIWNDSGDEANLYDANRHLRSSLAYDSKGNFKKTKTANLASTDFEPVKIEYGVPNLKVEIAAADIQAQVIPQTTVSCVDALKSAIQSFIEDGSNEFSPVAEVKEYPKSFGLAEDVEVTNKTAREKVQERINSKGTISLWREEIPADPEDNPNPLDEQVKFNCETLNLNPSEYWIFRLRGFMSYDFAAVNKAGVKQTLNWGIHPDYLG